MLAWWGWIVAGCVLGIFEVLVPAFVFLGFALGAVATGLILWVGALPWMEASVPRHLVVFGVLSLLAWLALRSIFGARQGQVKIWHRDINDN